MQFVIEPSQSQRPTVIEEEREKREEEDVGMTKEELEEAKEMREKEVWWSKVKPKLFSGEKKLVSGIQQTGY